ncbi:hypothetical protein B0H14DRAFT_3483671 [Mycena olivaceomarginata]|nr:hypothetical protein B0H14DRAFT_3483671 [Mycena olivaceomarginata]
MNLFIALLASFFAVAAANPMGDIAARHAAVVEAQKLARNCQSLPFIICPGGIDQEIACGDDWTCPGNGQHPITSDATCAAQCTCEIPCP